MGGTSDKTKRKESSKQTSGKSRASKKKKVAGTAESESQVHDHDVVSDGEGENLASETMRGDVEKNISECRKAMEEMLVNIHKLEAKVTILDQRITEVQLDRSSGKASVDGLVVRKRNSCMNEKDSLFKEAYESATGKMKVILMIHHLTVILYRQKSRAR